MAKEFPDRVAAIVDLMSHLFMLAVMLFVLAIPFLPISSTLDDEPLTVTLSLFQDDGRQVAVSLPDLKEENSEIEVDIRLDDGRQLRHPEEVLRHFRQSERNLRVEIKGYLHNFSAKNAVVLITNITDPLILKPVSILVTSRSAGGGCHETHDLTLGIEPVYRFDIVSCKLS